MGMIIVGRRYAIALVLAVAITIMPLTSASPDADASVIPQIDVLILPHVVGANVTGTEPDSVTFEGTYEVDQLRAMTSQLTITYGMDEPFPVSISPDSFSCTGPSSGTFTVTVTIPAGTAPGRTSILVLANLKPPMMDTIEAIAGANIDHYLKGNWTLSIIEPSYGATIDKEVITVSGVATFSSDEVDRVEVRGGSGDWLKATGTDQWSVELDLSHMTNGVRRIEARAITKKGVEEQTHVSITLDIKAASNGGSSGPDTDPGGGDPAEDSPYLMPLIVVAVLVLVIAPVTLLYRKRRSVSEEYFRY